MNKGALQEEQFLLNKRRKRLDVFLGSSGKSELSPDDLERLQRQQRLMREYSEVLAERIAAF